MRKMSFKKSVISLLDRPGGRFVLAKLATRYIRRFTDDDLEIVFLDGLWTRRAGTHFFPDGPKFEYRHDDFSGWLRVMDRYITDATDYWLQHYRPQEGDVIVDVGAGRGEDTTAFSRVVGKTGRVVAIEADPISFAILEKFCQLNRLTNVTPLHLALADRPGIVRIAESESSWVENTIVLNEGSTGTSVQAATFNDVYGQEGLRDIAFLKMNIEGAERYALPGMGEVIQQVRQICVACHDFRSRLGHGEQFRTRAFVEKFLIERGFTLASRPQDPRDYVRDHVFGLRSE
jgi:FkbM family methyltransferase